MALYDEGALDAVNNVEYEETVALLHDVARLVDECLRRISDLSRGGVKREVTRVAITGLKEDYREYVQYRKWLEAHSRALRVQVGRAVTAGFAATTRRLHRCDFDETWDERDEARDDVVELQDVVEAGALDLDDEYDEMLSRAMAGEDIFSPETRQAPGPERKEEARARPEPRARDASEPQRRGVQQPPPYEDAPKQTERPRPAASSRPTAPLVAEDAC